MKTILFALEYPPAVGGVENYYAKLTEYWPDEFSVIDNRQQELVNKHLPLFSWLPACFTIRRVLQNSKPDWLIAGEILPIGTAMWFVSHFMTFQYAVILHGLDFSLATQVFWKKFLTKKILLGASKIICANSYTASLVQAFINQTDKIHVVNPAIDTVLPTFRPGLAHGLRENYGLEHCFVLLSVGRLVKRKGFDAVISAMAALKNKQPFLRYVIIGDGPETEALQKAVEVLDLRAKVIFLHNVSDEQKWAWFSLSDAFITTSRNISGDYEGFGIVYLEANMFGKPVIAGKSGGVGDAVKHMQNGLVVDEENIEAIAESIELLASDKALTETLGKQAKEWVSTQCTWDKRVQEFYSILKETK